MNYYTLQVHYNIPGKIGQTAIEERKDLSKPDNIPTERAWIKDIREKMFATGIQVQTAPDCWEFISPFRIHTAYLLKQDRKFKP